MSDTAKATSEPVSEPTSEPISEPNSEPTPELTPEQQREALRARRMAKLKRGNDRLNKIMGTEGVSLAAHTNASPSRAKDSLVTPTPSAPTIPAEPDRSHEDPEVSDISDAVFNGSGSNKAVDLQNDLLASLLKASAKDLPQEPTESSDDLSKLLPPDFLQQMNSGSAGGDPFAGLMSEMLKQPLGGTPGAAGSYDAFPAAQQVRERQNAWFEAIQLTLLISFAIYVLWSFEFSFSGSEFSRFDTGKRFFSSTSIFFMFWTLEAAFFAARFFLVERGGASSSGLKWVIGMVPDQFVSPGVKEAVSALVRYYELFQSLSADLGVLVVIFGLATALR